MTIAAMKKIIRLWFMNELNRGVLKSKWISRLLSSMRLQVSARSESGVFRALMRIVSNVH
jgi:hypothetical protein